MPLTPRPLAPLALRLVEIPGIPRVRGVQAVGLARLPTLIRGGASPLRRAAEQHPAQHRDLLRQLRDPGIGLRERLLGPLGTLTPHVTTGGHSDSARPPTGSPNTYVGAYHKPVAAAIARPRVGHPQPEASLGAEARERLSYLQPQVGARLVKRDGKAYGNS